MGSKEAEEEEEIHDIVIVGGGICGLATALALHRKGIGSLVLERSESLRAMGAAIGVHLNGWRALDQLKVDTELRNKAILITGLCDQQVNENAARIIPLRHELRGLKRSNLIETLANNLPPGSIRFGCHTVGISLDPITSFPRLRTSNGKAIKTKVLIGCDGANSVIAKFLGLKAPKLLPVWIIRGFTSYPDGYTFGNHTLRLTGENVVFGRVPINDNLVHFFVTHLHPSKEDMEINKDPELIKTFMLESLREFPSEIVEMAGCCDLDSLSVTRAWHRAPWHLKPRNFKKGTVTIAGDAMHVMGPFLGQ